MKIDIRALKLSLYFLFILIIIKIYPDPNQFYLLYPAVVICEYSSHETLDSFKKRTFGFIKGGIFGMILALYVGITPFTVVTALIIIVIICAVLLLRREKKYTGDDDRWKTEL